MRSKMQLTIFQKILFRSLENNYKRWASLLLAIISSVLLLLPPPGYARSLSGQFKISTFPCTDETNSFRKFVSIHGV